MIITKPLLTPLLAQGINHLLAQEPKLAALLAKHGGQTLSLALPAPFSQPFVFQVLSSNSLAAFTFSHEQSADVTITLKQGFLAAPADEKLRFIRLEGDALMAQNLATLAQNLRWDAQHDLAKFFGNSAAHQIVSGAKAVAARAQDLLARGKSNINEFVLHDSGWLASPAQWAAHKADISALEKRIAALASKVGRV